MSGTGEHDRLAAINGVVGVVRGVVQEGHYKNAPEGLMACDVADWERYQRGPRPRCTCGWDEAKAALDAYESAFRSACEGAS